MWPINEDEANESFSVSLEKHYDVILIKTATKTTTETMWSILIMDGTGIQ